MKSIETVRAQVLQRGLERDPSAHIDGKGDIVTTLDPLIVVDFFLEAMA